MEKSNLKFSKKNQGKTKQHLSHNKEREFIWEQLVSHIHILQAFYYLEIQSQRFTAGKLSSCYS